VSLQERIQNPAPFFALPPWRKIVIICGILVCVGTGLVEFSKEMDIYGDPTGPEPATGHSYQASVMHSSIRYATREEYQSLMFWRNGLTEWAAPCFVLAFFLLVAFREPTKTIHNP
jgi:hypothetical protein